MLNYCYCNQCLYSKELRTMKLQIQNQKNKIEELENKISTILQQITPLDSDILSSQSTNNILIESSDNIALDFEKLMRKEYENEKKLRHDSWDSIDE